MNPDQNPSRLHVVKITLLAILCAAIVFVVFFWKTTAQEPASVASDISANISTALPTIVDFTPPPQNISAYIEVTNGCGPYYGGGCLNVRSAPDSTAPSVAKLRDGMVLKVAGTVTGADGKTWYKIGFDEWLRYPERVAGDWYVSGDYVNYFTTTGDQELAAGTKVSTTKRIVVSRSEQMLYAYDGDTLFMKQAVSTGLDDTPTPLGSFHIYRKTPTRYMQGPIPDLSDQYYDLPGVPWDLYFTLQGGAIHGAYWHDEFGTQHSHGCVNLPPDQAKILYDWADLGTPVTVQQ